MIRETKKKMVLEALEKSGGDYSKAAQSLGIHVNNLHRLIKNLGIREAAKGFQ